MSSYSKQLNSRRISTIKGRIITSVAVMGIISLSLVAFNYYKIKVLNDDKSLLLNKHVPGQNAIHILSSGINQSVYLLFSYLESGDEGYLRQWEEAWHSQINPSRDLLDSEVKLINKADATSLFGQIQTGLTTFESEQGKILTNIRNGLKTEGFFANTGSNKDEALIYVNKTGSGENYEKLLARKTQIQKTIHLDIVPQSLKLNHDSKILLNHINDIINHEKANLNEEIKLLHIANLTAAGIAIVCGILLCFFSIRYLNANLNYIRETLHVLNQGNLPKGLLTLKSETRHILKELSRLIESLGNVKNFALKVGKGEFDNNINVFDNKGELGESLAEMRFSLSKVAKEDRQRNWVNEGISMFAEILRKNGDDNQRLCDELIANLVKYTNSSQGLIFLVEESDEFGEVMEVKSCYALSRKKYLKKQIIKGEGVAGQAWQENDVIYLSEVPEDYIHITSGLGHANPRNVLVVPLNVNEETVGVLELASFSEYEKYQIEFIKKVSESMAASIISTKVNERTIRLLEESQQLTEMMRTQEEEMRQNMEELQATQEEMQKTQMEIKQKEFNLNALINNTEDNIFAVNNNYELTVFNKTFKDLAAARNNEVKEGDVLFDVYPKDQQKKIRQQLDKALGGITFSEIEEKRQLDGVKLFETCYHPIKDEEGIISGVSVIIRDITHILESQKAVKL